MSFYATSRLSVQEEDMMAIDDPRVLFNLDISSNHEGMLATLQDPGFQQAFGARFGAPPEVHLYRSTEWLQW